MHGYEVHACKIYAYEVHIYEVYARGVHAYKMYNCKVTTCEIPDHEMYNNQTSLTGMRFVGRVWNFDFQKI
jgi:hypothetical protein